MPKPLGAFPTRTARKAHFANNGGPSKPKWWFTQWDVGGIVGALKRLGKPGSRKPKARKASTAHMRQQRCNNCAAVTPHRAGIAKHSAVEFDWRCCICVPVDLTRDMRSHAAGHNPNIHGGRR